MTTWPRGPAGSWGDIEVICCDFGYAEEWGKGPPTRRVSARLLRCMMCGSRAVRVEWQAPGGDEMAGLSISASTVRALTRFK